ncbi:MAG: hypothetical protein SGILL_009173, partial [Bacillariaceae sp.]
MSTAETISSTSQYKVSEIINPDGTVTVRNLVITKDGEWQCEEEERDYFQDAKEPPSSSDTSKSYTTMHSQSYTTVKSETTRSTPTKQFRNQIHDVVPELEPAASFGSSGGSSSSSETRKSAKSRSGDEVTEGAGNELRRRRLAKARRNTHRTYDIPGTPDTSRSQSSSDSSRIMTVLRSPIGSRQAPAPATPPTNANKHTATTQTKTLEKKKSRPKRPTALITRHTRKEDPSHRTRHVAFLEPKDMDATSSLVNSSHDDDTDGADSLGYPGIFGQQDDDDESSVFRNVMTPSPEGTTNIEDILGPAPATSAPSTPRSGNGSANGRQNPIAKIAQGSPSTRMSREVESMGEEEATPYEVLRNENDEEEGDEQDESPLHTVTVHKVSRNDKIGIFVGLKKYSFGTRLVVSRVAPDGKFAGTGVDVGDIVVSVNGRSMLERPSSQEAFGML